MLEIIATCIDDAIKIEKNGGDRIELISSLIEGGITPSYGLIKGVKEEVNIPINVMIRPHGKSFIYSDEDIEIMIEDIKIAKEIGVNGIVLGVLDGEGNIDEEKLERLLCYTGNLEVTFHRAIDETKDIIKNIKILKKYSNIKRVLTSGGKGKVIDNLDTIEEMIKITGDKPIILVGGGLTLDNVNRVVQSINPRELHFGTDVRKNKDPFQDIDEKRLKALHRKIHYPLEE